MTSSQLRIKQWNISPKHYAYQTFQTTTNKKNELWKTVLKNHNYNPFQCPSMPLLSEICCVFIPYLSVSKLFFMFYSLWWRLSLSLSCQSSCKQVFNLVFGTLAKSSIHNEASKEAFSSLIPAWLKSFVYIVEANNHLTLASLYINFCHAYVETFCHDTRIKCGISTRN